MILYLKCSYSAGLRILMDLLS